MRKYSVQVRIASLTTAKTLIQVKFGAATGGWIDYIAVDGQSDVADAMEILLLRKTAAATVTSFTPLLLDPNGAVAKAVGGVSATGTNGSAEGTDGDVLGRWSRSVQAGGGLRERFAPGEIEMTGAGIIALKSNITITSQTLTATVFFTEVG